MTADLLVVEELQVALGGRVVLDRVSLAIPRGSITALLGPSGSGKTSLLRAILGTIRPAAGRILIDGQEAARWSPQQRAQKVAILRQERDLGFDFTVEEVVRMGRTPWRRWWQADGPEDRQIAAQAMAMTEVAELSGRSLASLSGGERQRALLARALAQRPELLLLDEPTNHLDVRHQLGILGSIAGLGLTVLAALHDLNAAFGFASRGVLLDRGRVAAAGPIEEVLTPARIEQVFGVRAERLSTAGGAPLFAFGARE